LTVDSRQSTAKYTLMQNSLYHLNFRFGKSY
jgi:hypothetical protein